MSFRGWRRVAPLVVAVAASFGMAQSAQALTIGPVSVPKILNATVNVTPTVEGLLSGNQQLLDTVGQAACPLATQLGEPLPNGQILGTLTCALPALDYQIVTRLKTGPGTEIVKTQPAIINVPSLVDVNNDLLPDFIATVQVFSLTQFTLRIDRMLTNISPMALSFEALIDDPTQALPRKRINAGYDARDSNAPGSWVTTLTLPEDNDPNLTTINASTTVTGTKGPSITTVAGLFNGTATVRSNPLGGRLRYAPVPGNATVGLSIGHYMEVRAGANSLTNLTADAELVDSPHETRVHAEIDNLPQNITVRNEELGADQRKVTYTASAPVPGVRATYTDTTASAINTKVVAKATNVPTAMTLQQTSARAATFDANNPLGSVEVGYATGGDPILMNVDHPYARVKTTGGVNSFSGRIDALLHASVDATDDIDGELVLGPDGRKPFKALVEIPGYTIDGLISDLPRHTKIHYSANDGVIDYDAFGETIQQIDLTAESDTTFFARVKKIVGQIKELPSSAHVVLKDNGSGVKVTSNNPIGQAQALLTSGPATSLPNGIFGAKVIDTPSQFSAFARVKGLQLVDFTSGPGNKVAGSVKLAAQPLKFEYDTADLDVDASLSTIPTEVNVSFDPDAGKVGYHANGGISSIDASAIKTTPFFGRATKIVGHVEDLPKDVDVTYKRASGDGLLFSTTEQIGDASVLLTSGPNATLPNGIYGATITDTASEFKAFARVKGLKLVDLAISPTNKIDAEVRLASTPLELHYIKDGLTVDASTAAIPSHMIVSIDPTGGNIVYNADSGIDWIEGHLNSTPLLFGPVRKIDARVERIPPAMTINFKPAAGDGLDFTANPAVGKIQAFMSDGTATVSPLADGHSGAVMKKTGSAFAVFARVFEVSHAKFTSLGDTVDAELSTNPLPNGGGLQDLDLDVTYDDPTDAVPTASHITGFVQDMPSYLHLHQSESSTVYDSNGVVPVVNLNATDLPGSKIAGALHNLNGHLENVPTHFEILHNGFTTGVTANAPFSRADLEAWDVGPANPGFPEDGRNKVALNTRDGGIHVQARVFNLKTVTLSDSSTKEIKTEFGSAPPPMDFTFAGGTTAHDTEDKDGPLDVGVVITNMPIKSTFSIGTLLGMKIGWTDENPGNSNTHVDLNLSSKSVSIKDLGITLPQTANVCVGSKFDCSPTSPYAWSRGDETLVTPNQFIIRSDASDLVTITGGKVCLGATNDDGDDVGFPGNTVYGQCADGSSTNHIDLSNLRFKNMQMEFFSGDTTNKDEDGDPIEDGLLKLYFKSDDNGLRADSVHVRNDVSDSTTDVVAGNNGRPAMKNTGDYFLGLYDLDFPPNNEFVHNRLTCGGLDISVDLPILGHTDVIPTLAELFIDICD